MAYAKPSIDPTALIAKGAVVIGDVTIGAESLVLFSAVLRGDCGQRIVIGRQTNVQDGVVIHVGPGFDAIIGDRVTIGHNAIVHGCTIDDDCLIGMGATVLDGVHVPSHCIIGANALVTAAHPIPEGSLVVGCPARVVRPLNDADLAMIDDGCRDYLEIGRDLLEEGLLVKGAIRAD